MNQSQTNFARNLRYFRKVRRLSQLQAARLAGVHPSAWNHWEMARNFPVMDKIAAIAQALKIEPRELLEAATAEGMGSAVKPAEKPPARKPKPKPKPARDETETETETEERDNHDHDYTDDINDNDRDHEDEDDGDLKRILLGG